MRAPLLLLPAIGLLWLASAATTADDSPNSIVIRTNEAGELISHGGHGATVRRSSGGLASASPALESATAILPPSFRTYTSRHYVLLTDTGTMKARAQLERLERAADQFDRFVHALGCEVKDVRHRLVCVLFADREEYRDFAQRHDDVVDPWIAGYYAPVNDRVVFYQGDANPSLVAARKKLADMANDVDQIGRDARRAADEGDRSAADMLYDRHARCRDHLAIERKRLDSFRRQVIVSTTTHEAVHQLAFHTGLQSRAVQSPLWLSEGLATCFETDHAHAAFGPDHEYEVRRTAFDDLAREDRMVPLDRLIVHTDLRGRDTEYVHRFYHASYALFAYFWRTQREALAAYFEMLRSEPPGALSHARARAIFESSFGPVDRVERAWHRWEATNSD